MTKTASPIGKYEASSYWSDRLGRNFSLVGVGYKAFGDRFNRWQYRAYLRNLERVESRFGFDLARATILECGFGTGFFLDYYYRRGNRTFSGVDLTEIAVARLQKRYTEAMFRCVDLGASPMDLGTTYDITTAFAVLLHITRDENFEQAIDNLCRHSSDWVLISDVFPEHRFSAPGKSHYVLRSKEEYRASLERNGFEIIGLEPIFVLLSTPSPSVPLWFYAWSAVLYAGCATEFTGHLLGGLLYGLDGFLMTVPGTTASVKLLVARRKPS